MVDGRNASGGVSPSNSNVGSVVFDEESMAAGIPKGLQGTGLFSPARAKKKVIEMEGAKDSHMFVWRSSASSVSREGFVRLEGEDLEGSMVELLTQPITTPKNQPGIQGIDSLQNDGPTELLPNMVLVWKSSQLPCHLLV